MSSTYRDWKTTLVRVNQKSKVVGLKPKDELKDVGSVRNSVHVDNLLNSLSKVVIGTFLMKIVLPITPLHFHQYLKLCG